MCPEAPFKTKLQEGNVSLSEEPEQASATEQKQPQKDRGTVTYSYEDLLAM